MYNSLKFIARLGMYDCTETVLYDCTETVLYDCIYDCTETVLYDCIYDCTETVLSNLLLDVIYCQTAKLETIGRNLLIIGSNILEDKWIEILATVITH